MRGRDVAIVFALAGVLVSCAKKSRPGADESHAGNAAKPAPGQGKGHGAGKEGAGHQEHKDGAGDEAHDEITLAPEAVRSAGIEVATVARKAFSKHLRATARISLPPERTAKVAPRVPGRVSSISTRLGENVKRSTVLAVIESAELGQARADYLAAATKARVAGANFRRESELLTKGITSEKEMREAESAHAAAKAELDAADARLHAFGLTEAEIRALKSSQHYSSRFPVRSPIDGTVIDAQATIGQSVESTTELFTVGNLDELWVVIDVFESQLAQIAVGQHVHLTVSAFPDKVFNGRVDHVGDVVDEKTRAVRIRVVVPNTNRALKPGMFATAEVGEAAAEAGDAGGGPERLLVPRAAVQKIGERSVVFVPEAENRFRAVSVTTGEATGEEVEIVSGLKPGIRIVGKGAFILKSELMKESMGEGHGH